MTSWKTLVVLFALAVTVVPGIAAEPPLAPAAEPSAPAPAPAAAKLTYSKHVAPIFRKACEACHRPGEVAPMSLLTYEDTRPWLRSIKKEVKSKSMPPWHADPKYGEFVNDPTLTEREIETIVNWIDQGAEEGDPKDLPEPIEWVEGWRIGKPDVVFEIPDEFIVPAEGVVPYKYWTVPTNFKEDKWIQAADARPGNSEVVHHILVFLLPKDRSQRRRNILETELTGYAPGEGPAIFKPGTAKLVPAGSRLLFQLHYTPTGKAQKDRSKVGFIFADEPPEEVIFTKTVIEPRLKIPPHAENHRVEASRTFRTDTKLHSLMPHMHVRGKSFEFHLEKPDGTKSILLSVPEYDFDWQHFYALKEPMIIPAGSKVRCIAHYDNSKNNPANPNPEATVRWGDQTWEEMMIGFLTCTKPRVTAEEKKATETSSETLSAKRRGF